MKRIPVPIGLYRGMAFAALPALALWCLILAPVAVAHPHVIHVAMHAMHKVHKLAGHATEILLG